MKNDTSQTIWKNIILWVFKFFQHLADLDKLISKNSIRNMDLNYILTPLCMPTWY